MQGVRTRIHRSELATQVHQLPAQRQAEGGDPLRIRGPGLQAYGCPVDTGLRVRDLAPGRAVTAAVEDDDHLAVGRDCRSR